MIGLFVQFAVRVTLVATIGDVLLAEAVHTGAGGGATRQLTLTLTGMLVPPPLTAVTEYDTRPAVEVVTTHCDVELEQPPHVYPVGLFVQLAVSVILVPTSGDALLDETAHTGMGGGGGGSRLPRIPLGGGAFDGTPEAL